MPIADCGEIIRRLRYSTLNDRAASTAFSNNSRFSWAITVIKVARQSLQTHSSLTVALEIHIDASDELYDLIGPLPAEVTS